MQTTPDLEPARECYARIAELGKDIFLRWTRGEPWADIHPAYMEWTAAHNAAAAHTAGTFCAAYCPPPDAPPEVAKVFIEALRVSTGRADTRPSLGYVGGRAAFMTLCEYEGTPRTIEADILEIEARHGVRFLEPLDLAAIASAVDQWENSSGLESLREHLENMAPGLIAPPTIPAAPRAAYKPLLKRLVLGAHTREGGGANVTRRPLAVRLKNQGILHNGEMNEGILNRVLDSARRAQGLNPEECAKEYEAYVKRLNLQKNLVK